MTYLGSALAEPTSDWASDPGPALAAADGNHAAGPGEVLPAPATSEPQREGNPCPTSPSSSSGAGPLEQRAFAPGRRRQRRRDPGRPPPGRPHGLHEITPDIVANGGVLASEDASRAGVVAALSDRPSNHGRPKPNGAEGMIEPTSTDHGGGDGPRARRRHRSPAGARPGRTSQRGRATLVAARPGARAHDPRGGARPGPVHVRRVVRPSTRTASTSSTPRLVPITASAGIDGKKLGVTLTAQIGRRHLRRRLTHRLRERPPHQRVAHLLDRCTEGRRHAHRRTDSTSTTRPSNNSFERRSLGQFPRPVADESASSQFAVLFLPTGDPSNQARRRLVAVVRAAAGTAAVASLVALRSRRPTSSAVVRTSLTKRLHLVRVCRRGSTPLRRGRRGRCRPGRRTLRALNCPPGGAGCGAGRGHGRGLRPRMSQVARVPPPRRPWRSAPDVLRLPRRQRLARRARRSGASCCRTSPGRTRWSADLLTTSPPSPPGILALALSTPGVLLVAPADRKSLSAPSSAQDGAAPAGFA